MKDLGDHLCYVLSPILGEVACGSFGGLFGVQSIWVSVVGSYVETMVSPSSQWLTGVGGSVVFSDELGVLYTQ